ncbi:MAG TPA: hypothetical protein VMG40_00605 [Bryobacteraceae bacterium]|nr:hypothetical protein [Bryobacteraceae bacterium]
MRFRLGFLLILCTAAALAQSDAGQADPPQTSPPQTSPPQTSPQQTSPQQTNPQQAPAQAPAPQTGQAPVAAQQQPDRILGIMPNFRAVSAGAIPPPPTPKQAFILATRNSFDYSAFVFVGITSLFAWGTDAHPQLRSGIAGYGRYYWRGFLDKTDGNYLVIFALPSFLHEDERYYAKGKGGVWKRSVYAASRVLITPNYQGHNTFNAAEVFGRAISQGVSAAYYPSGDRTAGALAVKFGWAVGRDALTNVFREFWPDIATHVLHRHP